MSDDLANHTGNSAPSNLKITDLRFADIRGAPFDCTILRIDTNQGISGFGEIRDYSNKFYALPLKRILLGENPCNVTRIFNKIRQFGGHGRAGGGVSGIEVALWDLAGKAYGVPVYQMLGGKFRDRIRVYCDTDVEGRHTGRDMGLALKARMEKGYSMLKMDLGVSLLLDVEGALNAPLDYMETLKKLSAQEVSFGVTNKEYTEFMHIPHPFTGMSLTEIGLDFLENYVREIREIIGYGIPLAVDHLGHIHYQSCIHLGRRLEKYNIAWMEDCVPWYFTDQLKKITDNCLVPVCTGEDIFSKEAFGQLLESKAVSVIHPDVLTAGGILETVKIADHAFDHGVAVAIHMAESPVGAMAAIHASAAIGENFLCMEFHSNDVPWWSDIAHCETPIIENGYYVVPNKPGLGIDSLNDEVLREHINPNRQELWASTEQWDTEWSHDRIWG